MFEHILQVHSNVFASQKRSFIEEKKSEEMIFFFFRSLPTYSPWKEENPGGVPEHAFVKIPRGSKIMEKFPHSMLCHAEIKPVFLLVALPKSFHARIHY